MELKGVLKVDHESSRGLMRVVFYGEPVQQTLKTLADQHSEAAMWVTSKELQAMRRDRQLRYDELHDWALWLEGGGQVVPMSFLGSTIPSKPHEEHCFKI